MNFKYSLIFIITIFILSGCAPRELDYTYDRYQSPKVKNSNNSTTNYKYVHPKSEMIKDSISMHRATQRAYEVGGIKYFPKMVKVKDEIHGIASWYGPNFHAKKTSNGETYNMYAFTAAHKTLPMNTMVKVYNLENGKTTIVRVNDRGPFVDERIIDLSNVAARQIDMVKKGTARVKLVILNISANASKQYLNPPSRNKTYGSNSIKSINKKNINSTYKIIDSSPTIINNSNSNSMYVQLGAFKNINGANTLLQQFKSNMYKAKIYKMTHNGTILYKVLVYHFNTEGEAKDFIESSNYRGSHIVRY